MGIAEAWPPYQEGGRVHGITPFRALKPFAAEIAPARLVEGVLPP